MDDQTKKSVAITGAGSGLGRELALGFANKGYMVFGTSTSVNEIIDFKKAFPNEDITLTVCDITKEDDVMKWALLVTTLLNSKGLNLLINNAGVLTPGPMEVLKLDAIRREFEVNVFGSLSVINAFLPSLRESKGRIVQIGSMTGRFPLPFSGPSSASKATMEAFADVLRIELKPFGIDFVMTQPGNMLTGGPAKTAAQLKHVSESMTAEQQQLYGKQFNQFAKALNGMQSAGLSAAEAAKKVIEISEQIPAPGRAPIGKDAEEILRAVHEKSDAELDKMRIQLFGRLVWDNFSFTTPFTTSFYDSSIPESKPCFPVTLSGITDYDIVMYINLYMSWSILLPHLLPQILSKDYCMGGGS